MKRKVLRRKLKKKECQAHRQVVYGFVLDELIAGKTNPDHLYQRYQKLKEVR